METTLKHKFKINNIHCAGCASKIETALNESPQVERAALNFATKKLLVITKEEMATTALVEDLDDLIQQYEKGVTVTIDGHLHNHEDHAHGQDHAHNHDHGEGSLSPRDQIMLIAGVVMFALGLFLDHGTTLSAWYYGSAFMAAYLLIGGEVVKDAFVNMKRGSWLDEKFLMTIATFSAWGIGEYPEAVAVMLFFRIGELFEAYAVNKSRKRIEGLVDIKVNTTHWIDEKGNVIDLDTEFVKQGSLILVKAGERIPLDGIVEEGTALVDLSALTGESIPVEVVSGSNVYSGAINLNGAIQMRTTADFENSMVGKILDLIENASSKKAPTEKFISKFARYYTPAVVFTALFLAIVPPLFTGFNFAEWIYRASIFLVVSCPCALVISVPLGYFGGIGTASKHGILVKGGNYLEALTKVDTVLMDKTGTVTEGRFSVSEILPVDGFSQSELLRIALSLESQSSHPLAKAVTQYGQKQLIQPYALDQFEEVAGKGLVGQVSDKQWVAGNTKLMAQLGIDLEETSLEGTPVYIAENGSYVGVILLTDAIKETSVHAILRLKDLGIKKVIMLTGDKKSIADSVGRAVGVDVVYSELLPHEKVEKIEAERALGKKVIFVGDGLNDAPALALADVGVAMGGIGADLSIEAADVVLMNDDLLKLSDSLRIAKGTQRIIWQNIIFALGVKALVLVLGALGFATMWEAVFADVGVALIAITNSMRSQV